MPWFAVPRRVRAVSPEYTDSELEMFTEFKSLLTQRGYVLMRKVGSGIETLKAVTCWLGDMQTHPRSRADGVVELTPDAPVETADRQEYIGATAGRFKPHTDGTYLDRVTQVGTVHRRVGPPAAVLLQCVQPAVSGGTNVLVDAARILRDILRDRPDLAKILCRPGCVSYARDKDVAVGRAVFEPSGCGQWRIRFRHDRTTLMPLWSKAAVRLLEEEYTMNPKYATEVSLDSGDLLVVDNLRMLHGRTQIEESRTSPSRLMRRTWVADTAELLSGVEDGSDRRSGNVDQPYRLIASHFAPGDRLNTAWGIRPDWEMAEALSRLASS